MVWPGIGQRHEQIAVPGVSLADGDLLVEVELATVCGSDLHTVHGDRRSTAPLVLGHEQVGRIVAIGGSAVAACGTRLVVGMRVVWSVTVSCGECDRCLAGLTQKCRRLAKYGHDRVHRGWELSGGFASHVQVIAGTTVVLVDEVMPAAVAAPASCTAATAQAALEAASASVDLDGATVLVAGAGMLGVAATAMAADAGATVVVSEPDAGRRLRALEFGAAAIVDPNARGSEPSSFERVFGTLRAQGARDCAVAIEMAGTAAAVQDAYAAVDVGGVVVLAGTVSPGNEITIDPESIVTRHLDIRGVHNYAGRHLVEAVRYLSRAWHRYPFASLVGQTFPLERADDALELAATGVHHRVALSPRL